MGNFKSQNTFCTEAELLDLKSMLLYGSGTAKLPSHKYVPCAEAELRHFRAPNTHYSVCGSGTLSLSKFLVRRRNFKPKNIPCVDAELQNFKSHNSLCAEAELQVTA